MSATKHAIDLTRVAASAAAALKADELIALDVSAHLVLTDVFLIASGSNERQVSAIADAVEKALHKEGVKLLRREGRSQARWVLLDFGDLIVHVQHSEDRQFYALEKLWKDCPAVELPADVQESMAERAENVEVEQA